MKHQANKDGLGEVVEYVKKGRGGSQVSSNVTQVCGTGSANFWLGDLGTFGSDGEEVGGHKHRFYEEDHGETGAAEGRHEMGDTQGISSAGSVGNSVGNELYRETTGEGGTVGGAANDF